MHLPRSFHTPDGERVAQPFTRNVTAARRELSGFVHVLRPQNLVEEVYVARRQFERLDLGELVGRKGGDDLAQGRKGVVQGLRALALADVGEDPLLLELLVTLRG